MNTIRNEICKFENLEELPPENICVEVLLKKRYGGFLEIFFKFFKAALFLEPLQATALENTVKKLKIPIKLYFTQPPICANTQKQRRCLVVVIKISDLWKIAKWQ